MMPKDDDDPWSVEASELLSTPSWRTKPWTPETDADDDHDEFEHFFRARARSSHSWRSWAPGRPVS